MSASQYLLTVSCPNRPGIVAAISAFLFGSGCNISECHQFDDPETSRFFMRLVFGFTGAGDFAAVKANFGAIVEQFGMDWKMRSLDELQRVLLMVSKFDHCLADILYNWRMGELPMQIVGVVSNHPRETYDRLNLDGLDFHYLPITKETKPQQEAAIWKIVEDTGAELVVLARYMQVLSDELSAKLSGRCINIHHSFLPGFKGAKPYHQAYGRGVKLIGATAHYVTADLDEGPIIEQDVERISHHYSADALVRRGRDIERRVLSRALALHLDGRVLLSGSRTIVFRD
jgi:formyltetrahydrofolate deformylase